MKIARYGVWVWLLVFALGCESSDPIERLIEHLRSDFGHRREKACKRLGQLGAEAGHAVDALRKILRTDQKDYVRRCAADALGKMAPLGTAAFPELTRAFKDRSGGVRMAAAEALGRYKEKALPVLKKLMHGKDGYMQMYALRAMKQLGPVALPLLEHAAKSKYLQVLQTASETLISIGRKHFAPPKTEALRKQHSQFFKTLFVVMKVRNAKIRRHVSWSLSELGPHGARHSQALAQELLVSLEAVLESAPNQVKMYAAFALRKLGESGVKDPKVRAHLQGAKAWPAVIERLLKLQSESSWYIRKHEVSAMGWLLQALQPGPKAPLEAKKRFIALRERGRKVIIALLDDPTWDVRHEATTALRLVGGVSAMEAFLKGLSHKKPGRREHSAQTLGWMGKQTLQAKAVPNQTKRMVQMILLKQRIIPALHKALGDPAPDVQKAALGALQALGAPAAKVLLQAHTRGPQALRLRRYKALEKIGKAVPQDGVNRLALWAAGAEKTPLFLRAAWAALHKMKPLAPQACATTQGAAVTAANRVRILGSLLRCAGHKQQAAKSWRSAVKRKEAHARVYTMLAWSALGLRASAAQRAEVVSWWPAKNPTLQRAFVLSLGWLSAKPEKAWLPLIAKAVTSPNKGVQDAAVETLLRWPQAFALRALLLQAAQVRDVAVLRKGLKALGRPFVHRGKHAPGLHWKFLQVKVLPLLKEKLRHSKAEVRIAAIKAVRQLPIVCGLEVIELLRKAATDRDAKIRALAIESLTWQVPQVARNGWAIPYYKAAIAKTKPNYALKLARDLLKKAKPTDALKQLRRAFGGKEPARKPIDKMTKAVSALLRKQLGASSAKVRKHTAYALGQLGKYAVKKHKRALLDILLKGLEGRRKAYVKENVCWVLGRWLAPKYHTEMIRKMRKVQHDPKEGKAARAQCESASHQLKSDDKPYILWVNHPRNPTLETDHPANLRPYGNQ